MKIEVISDDNRKLLEQKVINEMCEDRVLVNMSIFKDEIDENYKAVICYYE